jgi:RNA polymerase sigma factor (sigma-70 family)
MKTRVADPTLRREVEAAVRRRVRGDEAEDVVQATLADVLSAVTVPQEPEEFRRFVFGVARNKVFDHFRRQKRQTAGLDDNETAAPEPPLSARDILRWAEGELPDSESQSTLEWMLREGDGEKLEHIARDAKVPATRVRKRVSRLRKFLRDRWAAELMLIGVLFLLAGLGALYWFAIGRTPDDFVKREPVRPLPSAPRAVPPSRPAGNPAPLPNLVAPPQPEPSSSALPSDSTPAKQKAAPRGTEDGRGFPAPVITGKAPKAPPTPTPVKASSKMNSFDSEGLTAPQGLGDIGTGKASKPDSLGTNVAPPKAAAGTKPLAPSKPSNDLDLDFDQNALRGSKK